MKSVIIVDTNIIFSILRAGKSKAREIIFEYKDLQFYAPNFPSVEIFKHKERILAKGKIEEDEVYELLQSLFDKIHFVNESLVSIENIMYAYRLCKDVDEKERLSAKTELLPISIPNIEKYGGGSVRCMMAEIFLSER